jgi:uncharacterized membrane protein YphA (DoxX/SURF4 family)
MSVETTTPAGAKSGKVKTVALWVVTALLAALYVFAGAAKFLNAEEARRQFAEIGYPGWFLVLIAVLEIAGGLALLIPRLVPFAAAVLGVVMVGAVFTVLRHGDALQALVPLVCLVLLAAVGYARSPRIFT